MTRYRIRVEGRLDERWSAWFDGLGIAHDGQHTLISGTVRDQTELHGLLARVRDLGIPLVEVTRVEADGLE